MSVPFWAVIPAAGVGSRMRTQLPKQYMQVAGRTVLEHSLQCFLDHPGVQGVVLALSPEDTYWETLPLAKDPRIQRVEGGADRAASVLSALRALSEYAPPESWVLVHDAARPNLSRADLDLLLEGVHQDPVGGLLAVPARDTLKRMGADGRVSRTLDRSVIWQAYTPQMFRLGALYRALADARVAGVEITDEASAMEWAGQAPLIVAGRADNLKITYPEDLEWLRRLWAGR